MMSERVKPGNAVAVRLNGGMGNQLFQYAAGRALSLRLGCQLILDRELLDRQESGPAFREYALDAFNINASLKNGQEGWSEYNQPAYHYDSDFEKLNVGTRLNGFFQSKLFLQISRIKFGKKLQQSRHPPRHSGIILS